MTAPRSFTSFDELYRSQNVRLFYFFRRKVGREAAPDLVQEVFTRMLRCGAFERVDNPQAYLTRMAQNLLIERSRTWRRKGCVLCPLDQARDAAVRPEQEWGIQSAELCRAYRRALLALPRKTRRIFLMHRLQGMSYREISERVGVGENGVEYHMMRALDRCRRAAAELE